MHGTHRRCGQVRREDCSRFSAAELKIRHGDQIWRNRRKNVDLLSTCWLPWSSPFALSILFRTAERERERPHSEERKFFVLYECQTYQFKNLQSKERVEVRILPQSQVRRFAWENVLKWYLGTGNQQHGRMQIKINAIICYDLKGEEPRYRAKLFVNIF